MSAGDETKVANCTLTAGKNCMNDGTPKCAIARSGLDQNLRLCPPTNKDLSSMKHASTVGGAFRAGAVSTLLPGSYGALGCENASRVT